MLGSPHVPMACVLARTNGMHTIRAVTDDGVDDIDEAGGTTRDLEEAIDTTGGCEHPGTTRCLEEAGCGTARVGDRRRVGGAGCCADLEEAGGGLISHTIC